MRGDSGTRLGAGRVVLAALIREADDGDFSGEKARGIGAAAADDRVAAGGGAIAGRGFCHLRPDGRSGKTRGGGLCSRQNLFARWYAGAALRDCKDGMER